MSGSDDRPRRSWKEIDQLRTQGSRGDRSEQRPRGKAAEAREKEAARAYLKDADKLFSSPKGAELAKAMRDAHGSASFGEACRSYLEELGMPKDPALLSLFLDSDDVDLLSAALETLLELAEAGQLSGSPSLRTQLRLLSEHGNDNVAGAAEDLLEQL